MKRSSTPVSLKSSSVVSSVMLAAGFFPRAASTLNAVARMVPPTQKPSVFTFVLPVMSCTSSIARIAASSMYWSQVNLAMLSPALRQLTTNSLWPCCTV